MRQISSDVSWSFHDGMAEFHGVAMAGSPGAPSSIRQNGYDSTTVAIVPGSVK